MNFYPDPVFARFTVYKKSIDTRKVYRDLVKQVSEYIVANGYLPQALRNSDEDSITFRLLIIPARPNDSDVPLKDLGINEKK